MDNHINPSGNTHNCEYIWIGRFTDDRCDRPATHKVMHRGGDRRVVTEYLCAECTYMATRRYPCVYYRLLDPNRPIEVLDLSTRATNTLKRAGIHTLTDLTALKGYSLHKLPGIGRRTVKEIRLMLDVEQVPHSIYR